MRVAKISPRDMSYEQRSAYVQAGLDRFLFKDFVLGRSQIQKPPQCLAEKSLHGKAHESQIWLESKKAEGFYALTFFLWSSNDATFKECKKDLSWRSPQVPPPPGGWMPLVDSPYYKNPSSSARFS